MRHRAPSLAPAAILIAAIAAAAPAAALDRDGFTIEILADGVPLPQYAARGTTYVEALAGREYAIRFRNHTGDRVAVALGVDGLNTIDARSTSAREASKWIVGPYETIVIEGWQTGQDTARRFFFTTEASSYGAWLGRTRNLGVISAVVFRERARRPVGIMRQRAPADAPLPERGESKLEARESAGSAAEAAPSDDLAATGIGREVGHEVRRVAFDADPRPAAVLQVRYEYRDALVRLGVLPRHDPGCRDPLARRERARGFDDIEFAPDPYRPRCP